MSEQTSDAGLYAKYEVSKDGEPVTDCFVLRPDRDQAARVALLAYALVTDDMRLRGDLHQWVDEIQRAVAPSEHAELMLSVYEGAVADAVAKAAMARREAEYADYALDDARAALGRLKADGSR